MHKNLILVMLSLIILTGCSGGFQASVLDVENSISSGNKSDKDMEVFTDLSHKLVINSNNHRYRKLVQTSVKKLETSKENFSGIGVTSHHLPIAAQFIGEFYEYLQTNTNIKNIVVIGPDHPEKCLGRLNTANVVYDTGFGKLEVDDELFDFVAGFKGINIEDKCFLNEHSIGVHADYIKRIWGDTVKFVPITVSSSLEDNVVNNLADYLSQMEDTYFLISVDFNHYRDAEVADKYDLETIDIINNFDVKRFKIDHVDSPPSLKLGMRLAEIFETKNPVIFGHKNSYDYTGQRSNTTSYFNISFE